MSHLARFSRGYRSRSRPPASHQVPHNLSNHPPYTMRYGNPNATSWPAQPSRYHDHPILPRPRPRQNAPRPPIPTIPSFSTPSRWHNTPHKPQVLNSFTPSFRGRHPEPVRSPTVIHRDLANLPGIYPCLDWDVSQLPAYSRRREDACTSRTPAFNESAFSPGCNNVQITFNHPTFNSVLGNYGPIMIYPLGNSTEIMVETVMDAIYAFLQRPITAYEWNSISVPERQQIIDSYRRRISRTHHLLGFERARGPIRLDILKGCTRFAGLQNMTSLHHSALLYMNLMPAT